VKDTHSKSKRMADSCNAYQSPTVPAFVAGALLAVGIFASYIPQHIKVIRRRSSEGLSPGFLLLGSLSAFSAFVNIFIVTIPARQCCRSVLTTFQCSSSMVGFFQILLQAVGYIMIFLLCVFATKNSIREPSINHEKLLVNYRILVAYVVLNTVLVISLLLSGNNANMDFLYFFADLSGVLSTIFAIIQYLPQLWTTFSIKHAGSLSIPMMCLQTPGGYVWSYSLYSQPNSVWSSWLPYFAAANLQLLLLSMCLYFRWTYPTKLLEANAELRIAEENLSNSHRQIVDETSSLI
jgi:uncharacterized protein with PQ loop repeat